MAGMISKKQDEALGSIFEAVGDVLADDKLDNFHKLLGVKMLLVGADIVMSSSQFHNGNCKCALCSCESKTMGLGGVDV